MNEHSDIHLARRLEKALVDDERTHELGIHVHVRSGRLIAQGEVASEERRQRVLEVLREHAPDHEIADQLTLSAEPVTPSPGHEHIDGQGPVRAPADRP